MKAAVMLLYEQFMKFWKLGILFLGAVGEISSE